MINGKRIDERCIKNMAFMLENEGCMRYNHMRNEQPQGKHNNVRSKTTIV